MKTIIRKSRINKWERFLRDSDGWLYPLYGLDDRDWTKEGYDYVWVCILKHLPERRFRIMRPGKVLIDNGEGGIIIP